MDNKFFTTSLKIWLNEKRIIGLNEFTDQAKIDPVKKQILIVNFNLKKHKNYHHRLFWFIDDHDKIDLESYNYLFKEILELQHNKKINLDSEIDFQKYDQIKIYYEVVNMLLLSGKFEITKFYGVGYNKANSIFCISQLDKFNNLLETANHDLDFENIFSDKRIYQKMFNNYNIFINLYKSKKDIFTFYLTEPKNRLYNNLVEEVFIEVTNCYLSDFLLENYNKYIRDCKILLCLRYDFGRNFKELARRNFNLNYKFPDYETTACDNFQRLSIFGKEVFDGKYENVEYMLENFRDKFDIEL